MFGAQPGGFGFGTGTTGTSAFGTGGTGTTTGGFGFGTPGQQQQQQAQQQQQQGGSMFGSQTRSAFGASPSTPATTTPLWGQQAQQASPFGGSGVLSTAAPLGTSSINIFGGGLGGTGGFGGGVQSQQQQQQQQLLQQRQFWEHELNLIRDTYTPQQTLVTPGTIQQRVTEYKFPFRVLDTSTGQAREVLLTDHRQVENKLNTQKNEMINIQQHLDTLGKNVQGLEGQARTAKDRLEQCRETQMVLTNRFLVVLQRIQVMHNINHPFSAREKDMRDRLEVMIGRLEDAIRTLNEVTGVVDEEEADLKDQPRKELQCNLEPEDLDLLQQALEKQQQGLDYLTKTLSRDLQGVDKLKVKLDTARQTY